jgi:hypothetical protein
VTICCIDLIQARVRGIWVGVVTGIVTGIEVAVMSAIVSASRIPTQVSYCEAWVY